MRFSPHLLDEIRSRLSVSQVVGRKVALKKAGREWRGLSPFKSEKTPSFFVNDQKAFYHCFASGEHGDIFTFLMKTEGLSFPEAVERLAGEAGVAMPKAQIRDDAAESRRDRLYALLGAATRYYQDQLESAAGAGARSYIAKRGLNRDSVADFGLGFAPNSRDALKDHLVRAGFSTDEMIAAGMVVEVDEAAVPYDRFRNRLIFPITDLKGRTIAFGGRALDTNQQAKYLNSPETPLFHKGRVLFNFQAARKAAHAQNRVIVVEGYMDVVALSEAGVPEAVAPLGTALTDDQLRLLWHVVPEPIICFDGDTAGRNAAWRAIDTALPLLQPGKSLAFAFMPNGSDPDDLIRASGSAALQSVLSRARPLVDAVFEREWATGDVSTPERRAALEQRLAAVTSIIGDRSVRNHYERALRDRLWPALRAHAAAATGPRQSARGTRPGETGRRQQPARTGAPQPQLMPAVKPSTSLLRSGLVAGEASAPPYREALLLMTVLNHPWLMEDYAEAISALELTSTASFRLRDGLLSAQAAENPLDTQSVRSQLSKLGLDRVVRQVESSITHRCDKFAEPDTERAEVDAGWRHALELHNRQVGLKKALEAAERAWHAEGSEEAFVRIRELRQEFDRLCHGTGGEPRPGDGVTAGRAQDSQDGMTDRPEETADPDQHTKRV